VDGEIRFPQRTRDRRVKASENCDEQRRRSEHGGVEDLRPKSRVRLRRPKATKPHVQNMPGGI
jgi:hypothetical protein